MSSTSSCPVCGSSTQDIFGYEVRGGWRATLCRCAGCGFVFVADPVWLSGSFGAHLNELDVGSADRSLLVSSFLRGLLGRYSRRCRWSVLDHGGGDGLLTRVLRDAGVDARWEDPFTAPLYFVGPAVGPDDYFDLAVMSEVALHLTDPLETFRSLLGRADRVLFTAVVPPDPIPEDWWYLMKSTGQHVAFYPTEAIAAIAEQLGVNWCSDGRFFHLLSRPAIPLGVRTRVRRREVSLLLAQWFGVMDLLDRARGMSRSLAPMDQRAAAVPQIDEG